MRDVEEGTKDDAIYAAFRSLHSSCGLLVSTYVCGKDIKECLGMANTNFERKASLQGQRTGDNEIGDRCTKASGKFQVGTPRRGNCSSCTLYMLVS